MTVALWGGGTTDDLAERIRTGDVAIDLYRPVGLLGLVPRRRPRPGDVPPAHPRAGADAGRRAALRPALPPPAAPRGLAFLVSVALARRGQLRDPVPGRLHGVLAARRRRGPRSLRGCAGDLLQRADAAAGALPRLARRPRAGAAVGGVPPGARRHLARQARRLEHPRRRSASRRCWVVVLLGACALVLRAADPQGGGPGWLRPAPRPGRGLRRTSPACGSGPRWPTRRRS